MENLVWRSRVKIVAILDLIFSSLSLLVTIAYFTILTSSTISSVDDATNVTMNATADMNPNMTNNTNTGSIKMHENKELMWGIKGLLCVIAAVQLWAAIKLLNSTKQNCGCLQALKLAQTWRTVTIIILVLTIIFIIASDFYQVIKLIIRSIFLYVVHQFIGELGKRAVVQHGGQRGG